MSDDNTELFKNAWGKRDDERGSITTQEDSLELFPPPSPPAPVTIYTKPRRLQQKLHVPKKFVDPNPYRNPYNSRNNISTISNVPARREPLPASGPASFQQPPSTYTDQSNLVDPMSSHPWQSMNTMEDEVDDGEETEDPQDYEEEETETEEQMPPELTQQTGWGDPPELSQYELAAAAAAKNQKASSTTTSDPTTMATTSAATGSSNPTDFKISELNVVVHQAWPSSDGFPIITKRICFELDPPSKQSQSTMGNILWGSNSDDIMTMKFLFEKNTSQICRVEYVRRSGLLEKIGDTTKIAGRAEYLDLHRACDFNGPVFRITGMSTKKVRGSTVGFTLQLTSPIESEDINQTIFPICVGMRSTGFTATMPYTRSLKEIKWDQNTFMAMWK